VAAIPRRHLHAREKRANKSPEEGEINRETVDPRLARRLPSVSFPGTPERERERGQEKDDGLYGKLGKRCGK